MKETIYTIPVNEAFEKDCECPVCELKARFENDTVQYFIGPSLMEPDTRIETNDKGFCARHFEMMYQTKANRLGLGLMLDTYMQEQTERLRKMVGASKKDDENVKKSLFAPKPKAGAKAADSIIKYLNEHEKNCSICGKLNYTMERYVEIILQLFFSDDNFKARILNGKGFCLPHLKMLLKASSSKLSPGKRSDFSEAILKVQLENMDRIEKEVDWFTKKFDYRNQEAPWGNSRDALPRGIKKMTGADKVES